MSRLTHIDAAGNATMVDVGDKAVTDRVAVARGAVVMAPETLAIITENRAKKGDVLAVAQLAGIMAAKRTPELIPLCHPLALSGLAVTLTPVAPDRVETLREKHAIYLVGDGRMNVAGLTPDTIPRVARALAEALAQAPTGM